MKKLKIIKSLIFIVLILSLFAVSVFAQTPAKDCFEVKYLDFFGLNEAKDVNWSEKDIDEMLKMNYKEKYNETRFFIPLLVRYLKDFHPDCNKQTDRKRFENLVKIYFKVTLRDVSTIADKSDKEKLNFIVQDFYKLVQDDKLLPRMKYTWDDGPLYGEIPAEKPKTNLLESIETDFGKILILNANNQIFLTATNFENKTIWSRLMKGTNPDRDLKDLRFDKTPTEKTSLATIVYFYSEGERLKLYLKPDGKFMYYYHSW